MNARKGNGRKTFRFYRRFKETFETEPYSIVMNRARGV